MIQHRVLFAIGSIIALSSFSAGCDDGGDPAGAAGSTGTGSGGATGSGGSTGSGSGVKLAVTETGWVDKSGNSLEAQGAWYPYSDTSGCITAGHTAAECSAVTVPGPTVMGFPPTDIATAKICTEGTVAKVIGTPPDYSNMWGAGIGLDFNNSGGTPAVKSAFDATAKGVTGVSFVIDQVPLGGLRVEFPEVATDGKSANYADAVAGAYPNSNITAGLNTIPWSRVKTPGDLVQPFNPANLLGIQFHAVTNTTSSNTYKFCISELTLLK